MLLGIDVAHAPSWAPDARRKAARGTVDPGVGLLCSVVTGVLGGTVRELGWERPDLGAYDLLVLPMAGLGGGVWSAAERAEVESYVRGGGAVLVCGDGEPTPAGAGPLGLGGAGEVLGVRREHLLLRELAAAVVPGPETGGAGSVHLYRPAAVTGGAGELRTLVECTGRPVLVAGRLGAGRVAAVGNAELFTAPFLGREDNAELLLGLLGWLAGEPVPAGDALRRIDAARELPPTSGGDVEAESGPHVVDARPYRDRLTRLVEGPLPDPDTEQDAFLAEAVLRFHELPRVLRHAVDQFRRTSNEAAILLVKGLPVLPGLPATPADPQRRVRVGHPVHELWLAAFAQALGEPMAFRQEKHGQLFQNLAPTRVNATKLSSESSDTLLDFHTEAAFHPHLPDHVLLHCLRPDHERRARTMSASVRMVLPRLSLRDRALLAQPLFRTGIDYSFGSGNGVRGNGPLLPVLYGDPFDPFLLVDPDLMVGRTPDAEAALEHLHTALNAVVRWVRLDAGDLLVVDNRRAVHARSEFTARYDGRDRWLQRVCVVRDLAPSAADRRHGSRVIDTAFAL